MDNQSDDSSQHFSQPIQPQPSQPFFPPGSTSQPITSSGYPSQPFPPQPGYPTQPYPQQWYGTMPPSQMPPQPPKKQSSLWFIWIGVAAVFLLVFIFGAVIIAAGNNTNTASGDTSASAPASTQVPDTPIPTNPPQPTATPTTPPTWTTVQTFQGNGNKKTGTFNVPADWRIVWTCDPSSSFGGTYNVIVSVYNTDGSPLDLAAINTICQNGNTGDNTEEHQGGSVYLDIESEGAWTVQVQVFK